MAMLQNRVSHHSDDTIKLGKSLALQKNALCIAAICVAAMWCTKITIAKCCPLLSVVLGRYKRKGPKRKFGRSARSSLRLENRGDGSFLPLELRHVLPLQRPTLKGHVHETIVQTCAQGSPDKSQTICAKDAHGTSKNVQRLCEICAGLHRHNSRRILWWGF